MDLSEARVSAVSSREIVNIVFSNRRQTDHTT